MEKVLFTFGTRPEAIKMAPVIKEFQKHQDRFKVIVCLTAQHRDMLDRVTRLFDLQVDYDLNLMKTNQSLHELTPLIISRLKEVLDLSRPDLCFVQGDTTTTFAAALSCFYAKIPVAHIEAGLRSHHKRDPFPEEINRRLTSQLADFHFTPTSMASRQLIKEGFSPENIFQTGNTIVDALYMIQNLPEHFSDPQLSSMVKERDRKIILVTAHRRENFGAPMRDVFSAIKNLALRYGDLQFIYPVHPNPNVYHDAHNILGGTSNIYLTRPLEYNEFIFLMKRSHFILTDSGGVQEEAPYMMKPVLLLRNTTERPEGIDCGNIKMVGTNPENIFREAQILLQDEEKYKLMSSPSQPFGDGTASKQIVNIISRYH